MYIVTSITNIYRIQRNDSVMCGYLCIGLTDFMLKFRSLLEHTQLFSSNKHNNYGKVILKYFNRI